MDVQADQAGLGSDPYGTVARRPGAGQGRLFSDSVDKVTSFADTDQLPIVPRDSQRSPGGSARALRIAVALVAVAVLAAAAALGLVKAGVIGSTTSSPPRTPVARHHTAAARQAKVPFVTATGTGAGSASYRVPAQVYEVTVATSSGRSWVSIEAVGQHPVFAGILSPDSSQHETLLGPSEVDIGAGGTSVTITSGKRSATLKPLSAPFTYRFTPSR